MTRLRSFGPAAFLVTVALGLAPATPAAADYPFNSPGEVARLGRQLYDFHYGSNGIRSSEQFVPSTGVGRRSGRHRGSQGLIHAGHGVRGLPYSRRGSYGPLYGYGSSGYRYPGVVRYAAPAQPIIIIQEVPAAEAPRKLTREDIEMVPIRVAPREPKERAIIERITQADGSVKTVIRSVPIGVEASDESLADRQESRDAG